MRGAAPGHTQTHRHRHRHRDTHTHANIELLVHNTRHVLVSLLVIFLLSCRKGVAVSRGGPRVGAMGA